MQHYIVFDIKIKFLRWTRRITKTGLYNLDFEVKQLHQLNSLKASILNDLKAKKIKADDIDILSLYRLDE